MRQWLVTSISYNGSIVLDKRGTCSKTQLKISDNETNQSIHIKTKLKKIDSLQKKKQRQKQQNENKNKTRHKNKTKIKNAKYQQMILENDYINKWNTYGL